MKIMTILGTRPEIIRLSRIIPLLDTLAEHVVVHTGQNYEETLSNIFFRELELRQPNHVLDCRGKTAMAQIGTILSASERFLLEEKPDRVLLLGDTNSALTAFVAKRLGIPVFHMEAGNRCYDDRVPEEVNRRVIDHCSDVLMPYTERSRANLLREGIAGERIYVTGNPIKEVLDYYNQKIQTSRILDALELQAQKYFLVTLHRAENVDNEERLSRFVDALHRVSREFGLPVVCSLHPRTRSQLQRQGKRLENESIRVLEPLGLFDFVHLEKHAYCVLTDSGTVQEECCIFGIPSVTLRDVTERPETIEAGSNVLSGSFADAILDCIRTVTQSSVGWTPPREYLLGNVSATVLNILLGYSVT